MTLADDFREEGPSIRKGAECRVGTLLEHLSDEDAAELRAYIADPIWPGTKISKVLIGRADRTGDELFWVQPWSITRHRKAECRCGK